MTAQIELIARQAAASTSTCRTFEPDVCDGCNGRLEAARATAKALTTQPAISAEQVEAATHALSEYLNDYAPLGEHMYRGPAIAAFRAAGLTVAGESQ